jgi:hypothetical protein
MIISLIYNKKNILYAHTIHFAEAKMNLLGNSLFFSFSYFSFNFLDGTIMSYKISEVWYTF